MTVDKLEGIRSDLVRTDDNWQDWKFPEIIEALRKWTVRNPVKQEENHPDKHNRSRNFQQDSKNQRQEYASIVIKGIIAQLSVKRWSP